MNLNAVLGGVIIVSNSHPALQREACVFRELGIAADEVRNRTSPGAAEGVLAKSHCRLEKDRALRVVIKLVNQSAGGGTDIAAFGVYGAEIYQSVAPSLLRRVDHLFANWAFGHVR